MYIARILDVTATAETAPRAWAAALAVFTISIAVWGAVAGGVLALALRFYQAPVPPFVVGVFWAAITAWLYYGAFLAGEAVRLRWGVE